MNYLLNVYSPRNINKNKMKKIVLGLLLVVTTISFAQEKVLLRLNYKKGDKYEMSMKMKQDMGPALMDMTMNMQIDIDDKANNTYQTRTKFTYLSTVVLQAGEEKVNYNSDMKDEELSEEAKKFREQMKPMLAGVIFSEVTKLGENKIVKVEPNMPGVEKMANNNSVVYPEEAVSVGSEWTNVQGNQGMKMEITYKVTEITKEKILTDVTGKMEIMPTAKISGNIEIDRANGIPTKSVINIEMDAMGTKMKSSVVGTMMKL